MSSTESAHASLFRQLRSCKMGESGAIVGGHIDRNELRQELYVPTREDQLVLSFFVKEYDTDGRMLVITGSAGDGKSALLSRAYKRARDHDHESLTESSIHMDATASAAKTETYDETLSRFLEDATDRMRQDQGSRSGLAINLGLAIDFFERKGNRGTFPELWDAIDASKTKRVHETDDVVVLNLSHRSLYETHPERLGEGLLRSIVEKFDFSSDESPFYQAYQNEVEDCPAGDGCPLQYNAKQMTKEAVRANLSRLLAASSIVDSAYLNPRRMLDLTASIVLPGELEQVGASHEICPIGKSVNYNRSVGPRSIIWNSVFRNVDGTAAERTGLLDPVAQVSKDVDLQILEWSANPSKLSMHLGGTPHMDDGGTVEKVRTALRRRYLTDTEDEVEGLGPLRTAIEWSWFSEFLGAYTFLDRPEDDPEAAASLQDDAAEMNDTLSDALRGWTGDQGSTGEFIEFIDGIKTPEYRFLSKWTDPAVDSNESRQRTRQEATPGKLWFVLRPDESGVDIPVPITFELYVLMKRIGQGYNPNAQDLERSEGIRLIHSRLSEFTDKQETVRILDKAGEERLRLEEDPFGKVKIEEGQQ